jgi:uncharacterized membrane protein YedE/YeeE
VRELMLAEGPARYLGGSIETFALPMGAFIVIAWVLFYVYRRPHSVPRLKYLQPAHQTALGTREPGTAGLITVASAIAAPSSAQAAAPAQAEATGQASGAAGEERSAKEGSAAGPDGTSAEGDTL